MTDNASLSPQHLSMLRDESGITEAVISARGYRTVTQETELVRLGFAAAPHLLPGLLLPLHTTDGRLVVPINSLLIHIPIIIIFSEQLISQPLLEFRLIIKFTE